MNRTEELTFKYLDGALTPGEERELDALVTGDTESAGLYCEILKLDAALQGELLKPDLAGETMNVLYAELANDTMKRVTVVTTGRHPGKRAGRQESVHPFGRIVRYAIGPLAALVVLCLGLHFRENRLASAGVVVETRGTVTAGTTALQAGNTIPARQTVQTADSSLLKFRYRDGSAAELGPDAAMRMDAVVLTGGKRIHLSRGKLACSVRPQKSPMVVSTPHAAATVLGTTFDINATSEMTALQVTDGAVLLQRIGAATGVVVRSGFRATASPGTDIVMAAVEESADRVSLFNGRDLAGWEVTKGNWTVVDGTMMGHNPKGGSSRVESRKDYHWFELECRIRVDSNSWTEFQIHNYARFFTIENAAPSVWHDLKVVVNSTTCRATLDGRELPLSDGEPKGRKDFGTVAFYVTSGRKVWVKDVYVRELQ